jgi:hypothetical protein
MSQALLAFDTDRIKDYVFATGLLRDIRGASAILDDLNRNQMERLVLDAAPGATTVYAHGGSGLFVVDSKHAEAARWAVERRYAEATESASVSGAVAELPDTVAPAEDIHIFWRQLAYRLRAAKDCNPIAAELTSHAMLRWCEACGLRYSTVRWSGPEGEQRLCGSCNRKREQDDRIRTEEIPRWLREPGLTAGAGDPLWQRLITSLRAADYPLVAGLSRPENFDTLAAVSRPEGYMGLIYADGDGIGRELERLDTLEKIGDFARAVDGAAYQAVVEAVARHLPPVQLADGSIFPFDVLLLGGDDVVLVTAADRALEAALTLVERFSQETEGRLDRSLRLSATVILSHARYPFAALLKLAEGGLAFAKREAAARQRRGEPAREGLINFLVVSSTNHLDFDTYVERVLRLRPPLSHESLDRTLRPYTTTDFRRLLQAARVLADAPRTRVQQLREACFLDHLHGRLEALSALLRWRESNAKREPLRLVADFARSTGGGEVQFPWFSSGEQEQPAVWRTPIADVAEILDFVAPEESRAATP